MKISVALAFYDGAEYIEEQLISILNQFGEKDELILSVDRAFDGSYDLLKGWEEKDRRVFLTMGPSKGIASNYEHAIKMCSGDLIFLSGQDDVWLPDKIEKMKKAFHDRNVMAAIHDGIITDENLDPANNSLFQIQEPRQGFLRNLWKNSYVGCCMAFRKELVPLILPFPEQVDQYDYWIGTVAELSGKIAVVKEPLILYREHADKSKEERLESTGLVPGRRKNLLLALLRRKREIKNEKE